MELARHWAGSGGRSKTASSMATAATSKALYLTTCNNFIQTAWREPQTRQYVCNDELFLHL
eukprot:11010235-Lingulodinium_polyedra.AAC.1